MTFKGLICGIPCWLLICITSSLADAQDPKNEAAIQKQATDASLEVTKASGLATIEARSAYQKQLLEFVSPANRATTLRDSLTSSLISAAESGDERFAELAAKYQSAAENALHHESLVQSMQSIGQMNILGKEFTHGSGIMRRQRETELNEMVLELQKKSFATKLDRSLTRKRNHLAAIRAVAISPLQAATGNQQNFLLEILQGKALEYGYSASQGTPLGAALMQVKLPDEDLSRIRLKKLTEGGYVSFGLLEGSGSLGQIPFILRSPTLRDEAAPVESLLSELATIDGQSQEFVDKTIELRQAVEVYEAAFLEQAGTGHAAARKGVQYYKKWTQGRNFFTGLKATLNSLELENDPKILQKGTKYNSEQYGNGILPLVTFIATNSCQFAPAKSGDADVYVRLHRSLLELQALLGTE